MDRSSPLAWILATAALMAAFLTPAVWNGFPFVFYDSADYIEAAFSFQMPPFRLLPYAFVIALGPLTGSLWTVVAVQILANLACLALLARIFAPRRAPGYFLLAGLGCALMTAAPWFAGLLMPDAFTGVGILSAVALLLGWRRLGKGWRLLAATLVLLAGPVHATHLMILAGLAAIGLLLWRLGLAAKGGALALCAATLTAWLAVPALHGVFQGEWQYNKGGSVFLLARLVSGGIIQKELPRLCERKPYLICAMQDRLRGDENDFLWGHGGVFFENAGSIERWISEAPELLAAGVRARPLETIGFALSTAARQFLAFGPGDVFDPMSYHMQHALERRWPDLVADLEGGRQEHGLGGAKTWLAQTGVAATALGLAGLVLMLGLAIRDRDQARLLLALLLLAGLIGNALACGGLSSLADRYQARTAWIALAAVLVNWHWLKVRIYNRRRS